MYQLGASSSVANLPRLFLVFVTKLSEVSFLDSVGESASEKSEAPTVFSEDDDLDLCLYYLRTLHHVLQCSGDVSWAILASKHLSSNGKKMHISSELPTFLRLSSI